jgi:hypothetical protein
MESEEKNPNALASFIANIETRISKLTTLEIKTVVGDYKLDAAAEVKPKEEGDFKVMFSQINLLQGDINTHISNDLMDDRYAWLREFHAQKEEHGHQIIDNNIRAIMSLFDLYKRSKGMDFTDDGAEGMAIEP